MSDYYWQDNLPTALQIDYITQIKYTVHDIDNDDEAFEIKQQNLHNGIIKHRVYLPAHYQSLVTKFMWRYYLLIKLYNAKCTCRTKEATVFLPTLLRNIVHLDNVVEALIRPAVQLDVDDVKEFLNKNFDEYLVTEYLVGLHDPKSLDEYGEKFDINLERIDVDYCDWVAFEEQRVHPKLEGKVYSYDVENIARNDIDELWDITVAHYSRPFNHEWTSTALNNIKKEMSEE